MKKLRELAHTVQREIVVYRNVLGDKRTPLPAKIFLGMAFGYIAMPFDIIPDWIPVLGLLDDVIIIPGLVWLALRFIPQQLLEEHRAKVRGNEPPSDNTPTA